MIIVPDLDRPSPPIYCLAILLSYSVVPVLPPLSCCSGQPPVEVMPLPLSPTHYPRAQTVGMHGGKRAWMSTACASAQLSTAEHVFKQ